MAPILTGKRERVGRCVPIAGGQRSSALCIMPFDGPHLLSQLDLFEYMRHSFNRKPSCLSMPLARLNCDLVFLLAASDGEWLGIEDLLDSIDTYVDCNYQIVAVDDASTDGIYDKLRERRIWTARNPTKCGLFGLDVTIRRALYNAWRLFDAPIYVKIDPDALVIGTGLHKVLASAFSSDPKVGIVGTYRVDWNGYPRDLSYWKQRFKQVGKYFGEPLQMGIRNGYAIGDGVQGGCYAIRGDCLARMWELGFLDRWDHPNIIKGSQVAEDSIVTMLVYAAGFTGADIGGPDQAFGLWDVGLPMPPVELVRQKRIVTHSIKYRDEASLAARSFFRARRTAFKLSCKT